MSFNVFFKGQRARLVAAAMLTSSAAFAAPTLSSILFINADSDKALTLKDGSSVVFTSGMTLDLAKLPTKNLNIQALASGVTSVLFTLDGTKLTEQTGSPYAAYGDVAGNFNAWTPKLGAHTLVVTPKKSGTSGTAKTLKFTVVDSTPASTPTPTPTPIPTPVQPAPAPTPAPTTEAGWTDYKPSADTHTVYVSSSTGDDANNGASPATAVKTAARAAALVRDNAPDWILFKRGDTFSGKPQGKSGRSASEPFLIGAYGTGEKPYFKIEPMSSPMDACGKNKVFLSLRFKSYKRDPGSSEFDSSKATLSGNDGVQCIWTNVSNITFEDLSMEYFRLPFYYDGNKSGVLISNITFKRNIIRNSYQAGGGVRERKAQGMFITKVTNLGLIENFFYMNGWNDKIASAGRSYLNHSAYMTDITNLTVKGNISALSSSLGFKVNSTAAGAVKNVLIDNNFVIGAANGITSLCNDNIADAIVDVKITNNVHTHIGAKADTDSGQDQEQDLGLRVRNNKNLDVSGNIFVDKNYWSMTQTAIDWSSNSGVQTVKNNVSLNYVKAGSKVFGGPADSSNLAESASALVDASRDIDTYFRVSNGESYLYQAMLEQRKGAWDDAVTANAINSWLREGLTHR